MVSYIALLSRIYRIVFLYSCTTYFFYFDWSIFSMTYTISPSSFTCTFFPSIFDCMKAPGMSQVATSLRSCGSMMILSMRALMAMVGDVLSSLVIYSRWGLPSAHPRPFIDPSHFSFRNIRYLSVHFISSFPIAVLWTGSPTSRLCSCCNSFNTACLLFLPNLLTPCFMMYWDMITFARRVENRVSERYGQIHRAVRRLVVIRCRRVLLGAGSF